MFESLSYIYFMINYKLKNVIIIFILQSFFMNIT